MLIVPDINVLIHAFRTDVEHHETYATWLRTTLRDERLGIADVITTGFLRTVTHPRIFAERTPTAAALDFIDVITARSRTSWLQQGAEPWQRLATIASPACASSIPPRSTVSSSAPQSQPVGRGAADPQKVTAEQAGRWVSGRRARRR